MKCELCGEKIISNIVFTCESVKGSKLCKSCYEVVTCVEGVEASQETSDEITSLKPVSDATSEIDVVRNKNARLLLLLLTFIGAVLIYLEIVTQPVNSLNYWHLLIYPTSIMIPISIIVIKFDLVTKLKLYRQTDFEKKYSQLIYAITLVISSILVRKFPIPKINGCYVGVFLIEFAFLCWILIGRKNTEKT